jgi:thiopurine S-methyltransferase
MSDRPSDSKNSNDNNASNARSNASNNDGEDFREAGFWRRLYQTGDMGWDIGRPAPPLERALRALDVPAGARGRALVPGSGRGHEAVLLAELGWRTTAVDFAAEALDGARRLAERAGVSLDLQQADAFAYLRDAPHFDLAIEHTFFCAIDPARRDEYLAALARTLAGGGRLVGLFYCHGRPGGPPFGSTPAEVTAHLVRAGFTIASTERPSDSIERRAGDELLVHASVP